MNSFGRSMVARQKEERIMEEEPLNNTNINFSKMIRYVGGDKKERRRRRGCLGATERRASTTPCSSSSRRSSQAR